MDIATLKKTFDEIAAEYVRRLDLRIDAIGADSVTLSLPVARGLVHGGGVLCGQAIMSAADTAMLLAMIATIGEFKPMTTVQMQTSFLRPVGKETAEIIVSAQVLRLGKSLSYGDVTFQTLEGKLVAHATMTYALI